MQLRTAIWFALPSFVLPACDSPTEPDTAGHTVADLAFTSDREGNEDIYVLALHDGTIRNLTNHPAADTDPDWSPDGSRLAFTSVRDGNEEIYSMRPDGSGMQRLTTSPANDRFPRWRPRER
jgi:Tol biopolymer transport system component